jgi:hypothetical protein
LYFGGAVMYPFQVSPVEMPPDLFSNPNEEASK